MSATDIKKETIASKIDSIFGDFGKTFEQNQIVPFSSIVSAFENKSTQLTNIEPIEVKTIEDKEYLSFVFKRMILVGMNALEKLEQNIRVGGKVGDGEDFASAFKSLTECVSKLVEYNFKIFDMNNMLNPPVPQNVQINNFEGSSSEVLDKLDEMMRISREKNELKNIEAKFDIGFEKP